MRKLSAAFQIIVLLLSSSVLFSAQEAPSIVKPTPVPQGSSTISVREALDITDRYATENHLNLTGQYIVAAHLQRDPQNMPYWFIQWSLKEGQPKGSQYNLKVYMDGRVVPAPAGK